jgi:2-methylaconitate cis-trans-isomerase PrpF
MICRKRRAYPVQRARRSSGASSVAPDPYGKQIDGIGGGTSSTSNTVIVSKSTRRGHDVDYLFGQVGIAEPMVDRTGNCGNLPAAVGPFAISSGLVDRERVPDTYI